MVRRRVFVIPYLLAFLLFFCLPLVSSAAMQSTDYKISADALDVGGIYSSSANYLDQDTVGETGTGLSSSTNYTMAAGYQQMFQIYLSISSQTNVTMPSIGGISAGVSTSSLSWTVTTDDAAGYGLYIQASTSPALTAASGASFADYTPGGSAPDYTWSIASNASAFGFSVTSADVISRYQNNGSVCNSGSLNTIYTCWDGLSTSQKLISQSSGSNQPSGTPTNVTLEAAIGSAKEQDSGAYTASITVTAVAL